MAVASEGMWDVGVGERGPDALGVDDGGEAVAMSGPRVPRTSAPAVVPTPNSRARRPYFPLIMSQCLLHHRFIEPGSWVSRVATSTRPVSKPCRGRSFSGGELS